MRLKIISPVEYKTMKTNFVITYGFHISNKFGKCLLATSPHGICHLSFLGNKSEDNQFKQLQSEWPHAKLSKSNDAKQTKLFEQVFGTEWNAENEFGLVLKGTKLQVDVWKQLMKIPPGSTVTYQQVAIDVGLPKAVRAVANAVAKNKIGYLIPCHRVVGKNGNITKFAGGPEVKLKLLKFEGAFSQDVFKKYEHITNLEYFH